MTGDLSTKLDELLTNPAMLAQIKALADTMTQNQAKPASNEVPPEAQPKEETPPPAEASLPILFSPSPNVEKNLKNTRDLLIALKPFLDEKRCMKIDKMLSMMRFAQMAGQLGNLL